MGVLYDLPSGIANSAYVILTQTLELEYFKDVLSYTRRLEKIMCRIGSPI